MVETSSPRHGPAPGWYLDPGGSDLLRYWDGTDWGHELAPRPGTHARVRPADPGVSERDPVRVRRLRRASNMLTAVGVFALVALAWNLVGTNVTGNFAQRKAREDLVSAYADRPETANPFTPNDTASDDPAGEGSTEAEPQTSTTAASDPDTPTTRPPDSDRGSEQPSTNTSEAAQSSSAPPPSSSGGSGPGGPTAAHGEPAGMIRIPAAGIDEVYFNGTDPATLEKGPGIWEYGAFPGDSGNASISGHRTTHGGPFRNLDDVSTGDRIVLDSPSRGHLVYEVRASFVVKPDRVEVTEGTDGVRLTLTTCDPVGSDADRLVVQAEMVKGPNADQALSADRWTPKR